MQLLLVQSVFAMHLLPGDPMTQKPEVPPTNNLAWCVIEKPRKPLARRFLA